jgi:sodium transport system permease protein
MLNQALVIARKEVVDGVRDVRSVIAALLYALMGPLVVGLVSMANRADANPESNAAVVAGMMSVFTLVAAFVGGMSVAMDTVAGERERRSLLPLLLNPVRRLHIVLGKWLGVSLFAIAGLVVNLLGSSAVLAISRIHIALSWPRLLLPLALGIFSLPLLAASLQLLISTVCRTAKEAQTYLSLIVFLPMGVGLFLVFFPAAIRAWRSFLPIVGQQVQLELLMRGRGIQLLPSIVLGCLTLGVAILVLLAAANRLQHDEIVYGD